MKILQSGVELTQEEMRNSRGGMCACGCTVGIGVNSSASGASLGSTCYCSCDPYNLDELYGMGINAYTYVYDY